MMLIDFLISVFEENKKNEAIVWKNKVFNYQWLLKRNKYWKDEIRSKGIKRGTVAIVEADFSPNSVALLLALIEHGCVFVPITSSVASKRDEFIEIAEGEVLFKIDKNDNVIISKLKYNSNHEIYQQLKETGHPGLVLFSSGSTGKSKASVHDITDILEKFKVKRHTLRTITFLLYDHIGGFNTLLYTLSNAGLIVTVSDRNPDGVLKAVEKYNVELLPTSPTFINLILLSEAFERYNISSLKTVTYGTEPMPESTLKRFNKLFPDIKLLQTYGLSEVGILRSKSKSSDSLWVKVGGEGFETRVVDGMLEIKAISAMLGYLNAPSPFTSDGWFKTGDAVEVNGEYIKILGRKSEIINVGGEKVYPQEVENVIQEINDVGEVTVYGEKNHIMGNIVCVKVTLKEELDVKIFKKRLKKHCRQKLQNYKVPIKVQVATEKQHNERFKKMRQQFHP
jgi:long-chain acyl-CoA synthetase